VVSDAREIEPVVCLWVGVAAREEEGVYFVVERGLRGDGGCGVIIRRGGEADMHDWLGLLGSSEVGDGYSIDF
jgi:hypothetical protein